MDHCRDRLIRAKRRRNPTQIKYKAGVVNLAGGPALSEKYSGFKVLGGVVQLQGTGRERNRNRLKATEPLSAQRDRRVRLTQGEGRGTAQN